MNTHLLEPSPTFDDPLGMLTACHRRIERALTTMERLAEREAQGPLDASGRAALTQTLHYFEESVPRHSADEEVSLFPRMRAALREKDPETARALEAVEREHAEADALHRELDHLGNELLETGRFASVLRRDRFRETIGRLRELYREHIRREDEELLPLARRVVEPEALQAVGAEMAARRGIDRDRHLEAVARLSRRR